MSDWDLRRQQLQETVDERPAEYRPETIENANDVLNLLQEAGCTPPEIGPGYWPTISIGWFPKSAPSFEVFEDRVEVYHLGEGQFEVWYEPHIPGQSFSAEFMAELTAIPKP